MVGCVTIIIIIIIIIMIITIIVIIKIIIVMIFIRDNPVSAISSGIKGGPVIITSNHVMSEVSKREKHLPACVLKAGRRCSTC